MDPNEKLTGIASMMPQGGPPMGPPPGMGGGQPSMPMGGGGPSPMDPMMGGEELSMDPMMGAEEPPMNIEQDAMMLAEAVVGRAKGDIPAAVAVLDNAKAMLMSAAEGGGQEPQMAMNGGPMYANMGKPLYANMGKPLYANMGKPLYAESGRSLSNSDSDIMRQMIMDSLQGQSGRSVSDSDIAMFMKMMSDSDMSRSPLMREGGGELNPGLQALQKERPDVVKKILGKADGGTLMSGNAMAELDRYRFG